MKKKRKCTNCGGKIDICLSCGKDTCIEDVKRTILRIDTIGVDKKNLKQISVQIQFVQTLGDCWNTDIIFVYPLCPDCYKKINLEERTITFEQLQKTTKPFITLFLDQEKKEEK